MSEGTGAAGTESTRQQAKDPRRSAKRRLNKRLDALQRIENRQAELDGREPVDVITEYKRQRAKEREIIDVEVVEDESCGNGDHEEGEVSASHLPVLVPKISATEQDSNRPPKNLRRLSEEWWDAQPFDIQMSRCRADLVNGTGRCTNFSVKGARVCINHGAKAPAVKAAARTRLEMAADHLVQRLLQFPDDDAVKAETRLKAIDSALNRIGLNSPTEVVLSPGSQQSTGFDEVFEGIYSGPRTQGQGDSTGLGIESNELIDSVIGSGEPFDNSAENPAQQGNSETCETKHPRPNPADIPTQAGTPLSADERCGPLTSSVSGEPRSVRASHRAGEFDGLDEYSDSREYGRPARPGAQVSGFEAMRIAREAQELSRRLAGLESGLDD